MRDLYTDMPMSDNAHVSDPMEALVILERQEDEDQCSEGHTASMETITDLGNYGVNSEGEYIGSDGGFEDVNSMASGDELRSNRDDNCTQVSIKPSLLSSGATLTKVTQDGRTKYTKCSATASEVKTIKGSQAINGE
jgi:hypothetical protein